MANIWKPTQAECDLIRAAAARAAGTKGIKLEPGLRIGDADRELESMNIARVSDLADWEDTELSDFGTWLGFRKGVPLTDDGRAVVDFYVHDREELNTNVIAYYQGGQLVEVRAVGGMNLLSNGLHYVHPKPARAPVVVPVLKIDGLLFKGRTIPYHGKVERRIVANLIAHMTFHGWTVASVWDGEEDEAVSDMVSAMELIFNLDEARLYFKKGDSLHNVYLVLGNGVDCIADWNYSTGDVDGFNAAMDEFDCEEFA